MANTLFQDSATAPAISVQIQDCDNSHRKWEKNSDADEKAQNERTRAILTKHPLRQRDTEPNRLFAIRVPIPFEIFTSYIIRQRLICRSYRVGKEEVRLWIRIFIRMIL